MFNKDRIILFTIRFANKYSIPRPNIQIVGGAAMVLRDLRNVTSDIDIYVDSYLCNRLLETEDFERKYDKDMPEVKWLANRFFDIRNTPHHCDLEIENFKIQSLESILAMKVALNRDKDQIDIAKLRKALKR